jgi:hypothetical protein
MFGLAATLAGWFQPDAWYASSPLGNYWHRLFAKQTGFPHFPSPDWVLEYYFILFP